jgi:RimJ/RimL family protein N-acetyltransferase
MNNFASRRVLEKAGLRQLDTLDDDGHAVAWLEITKEEWEHHKNSRQNNIAQ